MHSEKKFFGDFFLANNFNDIDSKPRQLFRQNESTDFHFPNKISPHKIENFGKPRPKQFLVKSDGIS